MRSILSLFFWMITLSLFGACSTTDEQAPLPESVELNCEANPQLPLSGIVGISDPNFLEEGVIDLVAESGAGWARVEFHWSVIDANVDGNYNFERYDQMVERLRAQNIQILAILTYIPEELHGNWDETFERYRDFASAVIDRYTPQDVTYWEVFNEPNLTGYGWLSDDDSAYVNLPNYTRLLGITNEVVRERAPDSFVVLGGLASEQHRGLSIDQTMGILYGYGAKACFDIFAFHPYGYQNNFSQARADVQAVLDRHDDATKPVWFNEYGWTDQPSMDMAVNDSADTNPMIATFAQKDVADALFWFSAKDYSSRLGTPSFGLADFELNKRSSFYTFQSLVAQ